MGGEDGTHKVTSLSHHPPSLPGSPAGADQRWVGNLSPHPTQPALLLPLCRQSRRPRRRTVAGRRRKEEVGRRKEIPRRRRNPAAAAAAVVIPARLLSLRWVRSAAPSAPNPLPACFPCRILFNLLGNNSHFSCGILVSILANSVSPLSPIGFSIIC